MCLTAILLLLSLLLCLIFKYSRLFELGLKIPGPWFIPFIGSLQFTTVTPEKVFSLVNELRLQYRRTFRLWLGTNLWIFLHSPEEVKQVLNNSTFARSADFKILHPLVGDGLLCSQGQKWKARRKALTPAFTPKLLNGFIGVFNEQADILASKLSDTGAVEITDYLFLCVLDIICETAMGVKMSSQPESESLYAKAFHEASRLLYQRMVNPLLAFDIIYKWTNYHAKLKTAISVIHEITEKVIRDRKIFLENASNSDSSSDRDNVGMKSSHPLLDILLNTEVEGRPLTEAGIKEEVNTFLFAGIDTTTSALTFVFYNLGRHKDYQQKVVEEIWYKIGSDPSEEVTAAQISQLEYLDMFIEESMRFHTTVPLTSRLVPEEISIGDIVVPKNASVWINMYGLAHDPELFSKPDEFRPERFDKHKKKTQHPYSYLPYAGGPRICIGKKYSLLIMKVITIKVLLNYEIDLANPNDELELIAEMVLKAKQGVNLVFHKRI